MTTEVSCRCGIRLQVSHAGWLRRCPHCGRDLSHHRPSSAFPPVARVEGPADPTTILDEGHLDDPPPDLVGKSLDHYEPIELVGRGGMGSVFLAYDTSLDRRVALKILDPGLSIDIRLLSRFYNEARSTARIHHPNIVAIHFVGRAGGQPYFAMEYVEGEPLSARLEKGGALDPFEALEIVIQAARGLQAAHSRGIVHRDVKPSNLLVAADGTVKIVDFGLAKSIALQSEVSVTGMILGTPAYMAPEQARGDSVDFRADIYALGVTFFHLLTGQRPFAMKTPVRLLSAHIATPPPPVTSLAPGTPPAIVRVVERMMAKEPIHRYASHAELIEALEGCRPRRRPEAGLWTRSWAMALDLTVLTGVMALLAGIVLVVPALTRSLAGQPDVFDLIEGLESRAASPLFAVAFEFAWLVLVLGYFTMCHSRWGATAGKFLFGLEVVDRWGERPSLGRIFLRSVIVWFAITDHAALDWIPFLVVVASLIGVAWKRRAMHDLVAGTRVVFTRV